MAAKAVLVFYGGGTRYENEDGILVVPIEDSEPLPRVRDVVVVVDAAPKTWHAVAQRRVDITALFREGGRLILLFGPKAADAWMEELGSWLSEAVQLAF